MSACWHCHCKQVDMLMLTFSSGLAFIFALGQGIYMWLPRRFLPVVHQVRVSDLNDSWWMLAWSCSNWCWSQHRCQWADSRSFISKHSWLFTVGVVVWAAPLKSLIQTDECVFTSTELQALFNNLSLLPLVNKYIAARLFSHSSTFRQLGLAPEAYDYGWMEIVLYHYHWAEVEAWLKDIIMAGSCLKTWWWQRQKYQKHRLSQHRFDVWVLLLQLVKMSWPNLWPPLLFPLSCSTVALYVSFSHS